MPNSLKCRLKKLVNKGLLSEKDLERIVIIPENATKDDIIIITENTTNGDVKMALHPKHEIETYKNSVGETCVQFRTRGCWETFKEDWWNDKFKR